MVRLRLIASACGRRRPLIAGEGDGRAEPLMDADGGGPGADGCEGAGGEEARGKTVKAAKATG